MFKSIASLAARARQEGLLSAGSLAIDRCIRLIRTGQAIPPHTVEENLKGWTEWDWSHRGEEWTVSDEWKRSLVEHVLKPNIPEMSRVLEIGPGGGRWTQFLIERASHLSVVDLTPKCIEVCRERFRDRSNISFFVNDGRNLGFIPPDSIDRIWSFDVFVHIDSAEIENYFRQFAVILSRGGRGVIHHSALGEQKKGWRSNMTTQKMVNICAQYELSIIDQFSSWDNNRFCLAPDSPPPSPDVITVFEKP